MGRSIELGAAKAPGQQRGAERAAGGTALEGRKSKHGCCSYGRETTRRHGGGLSGRALGRPGSPVMMKAASKRTKQHILGRPLGKRGRN